MEVSDDERRAVERLAHTLKGSARQIGALGLGELAGQIERLAGAGRTIGQAHIGLVEEEVERVINEVRKKAVESS